MRAGGSTLISPYIIGFNRATSQGLHVCNSFTVHIEPTCLQRNIHIIHYTQLKDSIQSDTIYMHADIARPRGPMDKASAYGAADCRFESCRCHLKPPARGRHAQLGKCNMCLKLPRCFMFPEGPRAQRSATERKGEKDNMENRMDI